MVEHPDESRIDSRANLGPEELAAGRLQSNARSCVLRVRLRLGLQLVLLLKKLGRLHLQQRGSFHEGVLVGEVV